MLTSSKERYVSGWKLEASTANTSQDDGCRCRARPDQRAEGTFERAGAVCEAVRQRTQLDLARGIDLVKDSSCTRARM